jgi:hypothetical protein
MESIQYWVIRVIMYLTSSLFLSLKRITFGNGMRAIEQSAQLRMITFVPHHLLLLANEAAAGRLRSLICRAHFLRDGVSLFQATVSNHPRNPNSGHGECKRRTVVFPRCQLRTANLGLSWERFLGASDFVRWNRLGLCSCNCRVKRCVIDVCF